jgi:DNA-binding transcriptional LysR family regulator
MGHHLEQIRLRDLMLLEQVHTLGTLRRVAEVLHVTQPAVTQILKGLEQAFGVALVERGRRGVNLTAAGQAALVRLRCARHELERAQEAALASQTPLLRIGATPIATLQLLPMAISRMRQRLPQARITLSETGVETLWRQLADGSIDVVVGRLPSLSQQQPLAAGLRHETVGTARMVLVANRSHPLVRRAERGARPLTRRQWMQALAGSDWILPPGDALAVLNFNQWFTQAGQVPPQATVVSGSFYASLNMVACADLLAVVPEAAARSLLGPLKLAILDTPWSNPAINIVFAARESAWETEAVTQLRECFTS